MNGKKTLIIALIFGLVAGGYYLDQQRRDRVQEQKNTESRLIAPKGDTLTGLTMTRGTAKVALVKADKNWKVTEPLQVRADRDTVDSVLNQIDTAKRENVFTPEAGKLAEYGLDKPALTVAFSNGKSDKLPDLEIGSKTPDGGAVYATLAGQKEIFTMDAALAKQLGATVQDFRDKRTVPANVSQATTLTLAYADKVFTVERHGNDWKIIHPMQGKGDNNAITGLLTSWNNAKASSFIDNPGTDLSKFGLDKPYLTATAFVDGDDGPKNYTMLVGDVISTATGNVGRMAMYKGEPTVYGVADEEISKLRPTLDDLRAKDLITMESSDIDRVSWRMLKNTMPLERGADTKWHFADDPKTPLDQNTVMQKLNTLTSMKAIKFFPLDTPVSKTGLDQPNVSVSASSKDGKTSQTLTTGRKADDGDFVYCRITDSQGRNEIVGVEWTQPGQLFIGRDDLTDKSIAKFEIDQAQKAFLRDATTSLTLTRTPSGAWEGTKVFDGKPGANFSVEPVTMNNLLQGLTGLEWKRQLDPARDLDKKDIDEAGLDAAKRTIKIYDGAGKLLADMAQGASNDTTAYFSNSADGKKELYSLDKFRIGGFLDTLKAVFAAAGSNLQLLDSGKVMAGTADGKQLESQLSQGHAATPAAATTGTAAIREMLNPADAARSALTRAATGMTSATSAPKAPPAAAKSGDAKTTAAK